MRKQAELGAPPHDVGGGLGPFVLHQERDLALAEAGAEDAAEIGARADAVEQQRHARAVAANEPAHESVLEEWMAG